MFATHGGPVQISDEERIRVYVYSVDTCGWMVLCIEESRDSLAFEYFASVGGGDSLAGNRIPVWS